MTYLLHLHNKLPLFCAVQVCKIHNQMSELYIKTMCSVLLYLVLQCQFIGLFFVEVMQNVAERNR